MSTIYKIGITEAGDAGIDLSWCNKLNDVDGAILITKHITPDFYDEVLKHANKLIVHATLTGYGRTILEPYVPSPLDQFESAMCLIGAGFPQNKLVIRVDPIIPTRKGCNKALGIIQSFMDVGIARFRISVIDMYPHVRERFIKSELPLPYGDSFTPSRAQLQDVDGMLLAAKAYWISLGHSIESLRIESCAEPGLTEAVASGCISAYDLDILGLHDYDKSSDSVGYQRKNCMCYSGKVELLNHKQQCPHECLYCYWRT